MTAFNYQNEGLETVLDYVRWGATLFQQSELYFGHGTDNAFDEARFLVFHQLHLPWTLPEQYWYAKLSIYERQQVTELFRQRIESRKPAAYLTGEAWFAGLKFFVNEHTLVPRSPIAELIDKDFLGWVDCDEVQQVLDLCTGCGCIGIASLTALPNAQVDLVDISEAALAVAQKNVAYYHLEDRAEVIQSDLFAQLQGRRYDLIISNPPYVDQIEMAALPPEFQHEPRLGLEAGEDGLDLVRRILAQAKDYLTEDGVLIVEVGVSRFYLEQVYPDLPFYWFEFESGGEGVFAISRSELALFQEILDKANF